MVRGYYNVNDPIEAAAFIYTIRSWTFGALNVFHTTTSSGSKDMTNTICYTMQPIWG